VIYKVTGFTGSWSQKQDKGTLTLIHLDKDKEPTGRVPINTPYMFSFCYLIQMLNDNRNNIKWDDVAKCLVVEST
jgi:hypothetical protein